MAKVVGDKGMRGDKNESRKQTETNKPDEIEYNSCKLSNRH